MNFLKSAAEIIRDIFQALVELHQEKEFRRRMMLPYISLIVSTVLLIIETVMLSTK